MNILFLSSEVAPFAKTGGLGDVAAALPKALHERGHDVRVFMPLYSRIEQGKYRFRSIDSLRGLRIVVGPRAFDVSVFAAQLPGIVNDEAKASFKERLMMRLGYIADELGDKPYLMGENFSVADGYLFTVLRWAKGFKFELGPTLDAYFDRVAARPAVKAALEAEGLLKAA